MWQSTRLISTDGRRGHSRRGRSKSEAASLLPGRVALGPLALWIFGLHDDKEPGPTAPREL
jgi:hypothetical protein